MVSNIQAQEPSLAQRLPADVVRMVAIAVVAPKPGGIGQEPIHAKELLGVCKLWREATLPVYSATVTICSLGDRRSFYWARNGLASSKARELGWQNHARQAVVVLSSPGAMDTLEELKGLVGTFAKVTRVSLCIRGHSARADMPHGPRAAAAAAAAAHTMLDPGPILRILEAAFPATQQIKLEASNTRISHPIMAPISTIGHIVHMEVSCCPAFVLGNAPMPSLSSLVMTMPSTDTAGMISLARKHASSLVKLNVKQISTLDCGRLVADEHGATTVYARLKVLTLDVLGAYSENELQQRTAPAGTPFPALVHLSCNSAYPFANDVLLRGALPTLRKLVIPADAAVISWLFPGPLHGAKAVDSLSKFLSLAGLEVRIITRAHPLDARNIAMQARILGAASQAPQLKWLRIKFPNSSVAEYSSGKNS